MAYTYPAMVAWDPNAKTGVFNTVFQAFTTTDTSFTTPLAVLDAFGNPLTGNNLNSGAQGIIPQFQQATNATVVVRSLAGTYAWTIIAIQPPTQDSAVAGFVNSSASSTSAAIRSQAAGVWQANTAYTVNQPVINPTGDLMRCTTAHTSTTTYDSTKFTLTATDPASATSTALNGTYASPIGATVGLIGDSITNNNGMIGGYLYSSGYWSHADALLGHRLNLTYIDGIAGSGCTDANWMGRVRTMAGKKLPWCVVEIGTNDVFGAQTLGAITASLTATLDTLKAAGSLVLIFTIPPRNGLSAPQIAIHGLVNTWIRQLPATRTGVMVADVAGYVTDSSAATAATYIATYTDDGIHPNPAGCQQFGKAIYAALNQYVQPLHGLILPQNDGSNLISVAASQYAGGTTAQPTSWVGTNTGVTFSQVARTDGMPGIVQRVTVANGSISNLHATVPGSAYAVGDRVVGFLEVLTVAGIDPAPAAQTQYTQLYLQAFTAAYASAGITGTLYRNGTPNNFPPLAGTWQTPTLTVAAGGTQEIDVFITLSGGGTYDLGRVGVVKVGATY